MNQAPMVFMNKLNWYYNRLKKMPIAEYPYRLEEWVRKKEDKYFTQERNLKPSVSPSIQIKKTQLDGIGDLIPGLHSKIQEGCESILKHRFKIFDIEKDFEDPIQWHLDPKTQNTWPLEFWGDIDYRDSRKVGGIKFAWELNRLHHFPRLALGFTLTQNENFKKEIFNQLESWITSNPYPVGIHWISGLELGIRVINLIYTLKILGQESLTQDERSLVLSFISTHARHLYRYPSKHSSAGNHVLGEALGLFAIGLCFPEIDSQRHYKNLGKKILEREVTRQIYSDGGSFEHSLFYLQFVLDHFLVFFFLATEYKEPISPRVEEKLRASFDFISHLVDSGGNYPHIGDDDEGYLLKPWPHEQNLFLSLLNTGAILFEKPEWIHKESALDIKTFILLGSKAVGAGFPGPDGETPPLQTKNQFIKRNHRPRSRYFKESGIVAIRDEKSRMLFIGNSSPLGLKPLAGHGHADALSVWLSVGGKPFLIDPGTYLYHSGGQWRDYFRSTAAHNTIRIDGKDQAEILTDFMYQNFYEIEEPVFRQTEEKIYWSAGHNGYLRLPDAVFHKRKVVFLKAEGKILIKDFLECSQKHEVECFFHFHPSCEFSREGRTFRVRNGDTEIKMDVDSEWSHSRWVRGKEDPPLGWYSKRFNHLQETNSLVLSTEIQRPCLLSTEIRF